MTDTLEKLEELNLRLAACWLSRDWSEAEAVLRQMRDDAVGSEFIETLSEFTSARRLESQGDLEGARKRFAELRLEMETYLSDDPEAEADAGAETLLYFKHVFEQWELTVTLQCGELSDSQQQEIEAKLIQVNRALSEHRHELEAHRRTRMLKELKATDKGDILSEPFAQMLLESPLGTATFEFMNMVTHAPMLLSRPGSLQAGFVAMLQQVGADVGDFELQVVRPWMSQQKNRRRFQLKYNADCSRHLIESARARTVHRIFCDSWRRGSSPERHSSIRDQHLAGNERTIEGACAIARFMHRVEQVSHPEEKNEQLANAIHALVELFYKDALVALYRLEFDRDDLERIPGHPRQLGIQLTKHWQKCRHADRLSLINMDALIIRNAVAHHHVRHVPDGRVRFESISQKGAVDSVGPMTPEELQACFDSVFTTYTDILNAFNYLPPPRYRHSLVPMSW